jgi:metabotropic X receptor
LQQLDPTDETRCVQCPLGSLPDDLHLECLPLPEQYLRPESSLAAGALAFALAGILLTCIVTAVFVRNNDTPVVRASGRELSYVLLGGTMLCYCCTFLLLVSIERNANEHVPRG